VVEAAALAEEAGADSITVHLREDRRHIQDNDVAQLCAHSQTRVNLEMAITEEMLAIALKHHPFDVCLVPEKRQELTTEGGLDVAGQAKAVAAAATRLSEAGIHFDNVQPVARLPHMTELNIGHAIISRSIFVGLPAAVREMRKLIAEA
jgi:pyridoxine 5'-phosphate synthase PdxJ